MSRMVTWGWATKRKNAAYRLTRFHSKTAPAGMFPRMNPCSRMTKIIPTTSSVPGPVTNRSVNGAANSRNVPAWAIAFPRRDGRRSSGYDTNMRRRTDGLFTSGCSPSSLG
jgi:hypothetical protein